VTVHRIGRPFAGPAAPRADARSAEAATAGDRRAIFLLLPVAFLVIVGLGALLSASSVVGIRETGDHLYYFKRQLVWVALGIGAMLVASRVPYRLYGRYAGWILFLAIAGLVATLAIGEVRFGARRWIVLGPVTVQPSEFAKFAAVAFLAAALARKEQWLEQFSHFFWPVAMSVGGTGALLMLQPDFGTTLLVAGSGLLVVLASRAPARYLFGAGVATAVAGVVFAFAEPYRVRRLTGFLDPLADRLDTGLQATQSLVALSTGGWFGVGLGASRARWSFLPNAHTDFIFAIVGEETGFAGAIVVIGLFTLFAVAGAVVARRAPDRFGRLLTVGIVGWLSLQALVNVGGVTALLPITGVPLPFVSSGGSAMLVNLAAVGVLINIARSRPAPRRP
jgi:cell division protein FtsW